MRRAVYFTANETQKIDRTGKYVVENGTLVLNQSQATSCEEGGCFFNLGVIVFRTPVVGGRLGRLAVVLQVDLDPFAVAPGYFDGADSDTVGPELGPQIGADFPASLAGLTASGKFS